MSAAVVIAGYIVMMLVTGRLFIGYMQIDRDELIGDHADQDSIWFTVFAMIFWPFALSAAFFIGSFRGALWLLTIPPRRERLEARRERLNKRIAELERETGIR